MAQAGNPSTTGVGIRAQLLHPVQQLLVLLLAQASLPFDGIAFEPRQSLRYRSSIDPAKLTRGAQKELEPSDPPVFLSFLLALGAGLRRIEIDRLECAAFRWNHNVIRIEPTQYFEPKATLHALGRAS